MFLHEVKMKLIEEPSIVNWFMKILNNKDEYEIIQFWGKCQFRDSRIKNHQISESDNAWW